VTALIHGLKLVNGRDTAFSFDDAQRFHCKSKK
jgi:hypothetical protein